MKNLLFVALGMFLGFVLIKILASKGEYKSDTTKNFVALAKTGQAMNLTRTNEFRELVKTPEFNRLIKTLADDQINALSNALL